MMKRKTHASRLVWPDRPGGQSSRAALCAHAGWRPHLAYHHREETCGHCLRLLANGERASFVGPLRVIVTPIYRERPTCQHD